MKPPGIEMVLRDGALCIGVTETNRVTDKVWAAVQEAIAAGWSPEKFRREAKDAWAYELDQNKRWDMQGWDKP